MGFAVVVAVLALVRCVFPEVAGQRPATVADPPVEGGVEGAPEAVPAKEPVAQTRFRNADGSLRKNRIYSVPSFKNTFPDNNDVQLEAAGRYGVSLSRTGLRPKTARRTLCMWAATPIITLTT